METEAVICQQGNAIGINIPLSILRHMGFSVGQAVFLQATPEGLLIRAKQVPRFTAAELNGLCDPDAPMPEDLRDWEDMSPTGTEQ